MENSKPCFSSDGRATEKLYTLLNQAKLQAEPEVGACLFLLATRSVKEINHKFPFIVNLLYTLYEYTLHYIHYIIYISTLQYVYVIQSTVHPVFAELQDFPPPRFTRPPEIEAPAKCFFEKLKDPSKYKTRGVYFSSVSIVGVPDDIVPVSVATAAHLPCRCTSVGQTQRNPSEILGKNLIFGFYIST